MEEFKNVKISHEYLDYENNKYINLTKKTIFYFECEGIKKMEIAFIIYDSIQKKNLLFFIQPQKYYKYLTSYIKKINNNQVNFQGYLTVKDLTKMSCEVYGLGFIRPNEYWTNGWSDY